jgi:putative SOS response-associated peptidase YedK
MFGGADKSNGELQSYIIGANTAAADEGLLDIHDRRPLVYSPDAASKWLSENTTGKEAEDIAHEGSLHA